MTHRKEADCTFRMNFVLFIIMAAGQDDEAHQQVSTTRRHPSGPPPIKRIPFSCKGSVKMTIDLDVAIRILRLLTPLAASMAMGTVTLGLTTSHWLYSEEKMTNPKFNRTGDPELEYLSKFTSSGLWTLCYTNREFIASSFQSLRFSAHDDSFAYECIAGELERQCFNIDYFPVEEYSPDPNDSTLSIPCK